MEFTNSLADNSEHLSVDTGCEDGIVIDWLLVIDGTSMESDVSGKINGLSSLGTSGLLFNDARSLVELDLTA